MLINHVGITVGDLDAGVQWYSAVFGLTVLAGPTETGLAGDARARRLDIFGPRWGGMRLAHLIDDSGVGIEMFEFIKPPTVIADEPFAYWRTGLWHVAFTVEDLEATREKITELGGRARTGIYKLGNSGCHVCYCEDPWGTALELSTKPYRTIALG
jgi:predicted enzyme related to lactoylglutathione lyase